MKKKKVKVCRNGQFVLTASVSLKGLKSQQVDGDGVDVAAASRRVVHPVTTVTGTELHKFLGDGETRAPT